MLQALKAATQGRACLGRFDRQTKQVRCWAALFSFSPTQCSPPRTGWLMLYLLLENTDFLLNCLNKDFLFHALISRIGITAAVSALHLFHISFYAPLCPTLVSFSPPNTVSCPRNSLHSLHISRCSVIMDVLHKVQLFHINGLREHLGMTTHLSGVLLI